jgi:hypothetical protein
MPTKVNAANAVVSAVEMACALYGVPCYRQQSRAFQVVGKGGRQRPMFIGQWRDETGQLHFAGMADLLLTPQVLWRTQNPCFNRVCVPLWVECKAGSGRLSVDQQAFRDDVLAAGAYYIEAHDSAAPVVDWFEAHGVKR